MAQTETLTHAAPAAPFLQIQHIIKKFDENNYMNIDFGGNSSFAYSATFSDQVIQGMRFARKVIENDAE